MRSMKTFSTLSSSSWADGRPSIEIGTYDYSEAGAGAILNALRSLQSFELPTLTVGLDVLSAEFEMAGEPVILHMDNYTCSLGFKSAAKRDEVLRLLQSSHG